MGIVFAEDLVYALSVLVDRDLWVLDDVARLGVRGFMRRLVERGLEPLLGLTSYTLFLVFTWVSAVAGVLGLVGEFKEPNRDKLAKLSREYAEEVEDYLDTLDLLLDDKVYRELVEQGVVEKRRVHGLDVQDKLGEKG